MASALIIQLAGQGALAATYYWGGGNMDIPDNTPISSNSVALCGVWNLTIKNWATTPSGTTYTNWPSSGSDNVAYFTSFTNGSPNYVIVTQTADVALSGVISDSSATPNGTYTAYFDVIGTNARAITLTGQTPFFNLKGQEANAFFRLGANISLVAPNGFVKVTNSAQLKLSGNCTNVGGTVSLLFGNGPASYPSLVLNSGVSMKNVSFFDAQCGSLLVTAAAGANDQINDSAMIRCSGIAPNGSGSTVALYAPGGFAYAGSGSASTEKFSQIVLDSFANFVINSAVATKPTLMLTHPTAGISRGTDGHGSAQIKADASNAFKTDLVVSNGLVPGGAIPWLATDDGRPVKLNASKILEAMPIIGAPVDLSTWSVGVDYAVTNTAFSAINAIPAGLAINTLCLNGPTTGGFVLPIGGSASDTLTISSGMISFQGNGSASTPYVITNGCLTSGTTELNLLTGHNGEGSGVLKIYSTIKGALSLIEGGSAGVILAASNTFDGVTYVNYGRINAVVAHAIPSNLVIAAGGRFSAGANNSIATNASILIRKNGRYYQENNMAQTLSGTLTLDGGVFEVQTGGNGLTFDNSGYGILFSNGGSITQQQMNGSMPLYLLTDVRYAAASSNQAFFATINTTNMLQFLDLTYSNGAARTFDVSNSIALPSATPEMVVDIPLRETVGYPGSLSKIGDGSLELRRISGAVSGGAVVSNGTLLLDAYVAATNLTGQLTMGTQVLTGLATTAGLQIGQLVTNKTGTRAIINTIDSASRVTLSVVPLATTNINLSFLACSPLGTGSVTVVNSGILGGTGGVAGDVTVKSGGTLAPGITTNTVATFNVGRNLLVESGGILSVDLTASTNDVIAVAGTANITGAILAVNGPKPVAGQTLTILTATSVTGTFGTVPDGYSVKTVANTLQLSRAAAGFVFSVE